VSKKVLRGRPSDHPYLHKDFHGALSFAVDYVEERFGAEALRELLGRVARTVFSPLIAQAREGGLEAMRKHLCRVFTEEGGEFEAGLDEGELVFVVRRCPAISHMRRHGYRVATHFCETTRIVNEAISAEVGWSASVDHDQERGTCVQRFCVSA